MKRIQRERERMSESKIERKRTKEGERKKGMSKCYEKKK